MKIPGITVYFIYMSNLEGSVKVSNNKDTKKNNAVVIMLVILLFLIGGLAISVYLVQRQTFVKSEAYTQESTDQQLPGNKGSIDKQNSYIFASPLRAKAKGQEYIRVTVYVLDPTGNGVMGKRVEIKDATNNVQIKSQSSVTDANGSAYFDIYSPLMGAFALQAYVEGEALEQNVTVVFD